MDISISLQKDFDDSDIRPVFESNGWSLKEGSVEVRSALSESDCVVSAWVNDSLVGIANAITDSGLTVYIHYVIVSLNHQGVGIGKKLVNELLASFPNYKHVVLATSNENLKFFEKLGFFSSEEMRVVERRRAS